MINAGERMELSGKFLPIVVQMKSANSFETVAGWHGYGMGGE